MYQWGGGRTALANEGRCTFVYAYPREGHEVTGGGDYEKQCSSFKKTGQNTIRRCGNELKKRETNVMRKTGLTCMGGAVSGRGDKVADNFGQKNQKPV